MNDLKTSNPFQTVQRKHLHAKIASAKQRKTGGRTTSESSAEESSNFAINAPATEALGTTILHTICFMRERLDYKNIFMHGARKNIKKIDTEWGKKINDCSSFALRNVGRFTAWRIPGSQRPFFRAIRMCLHSLTRRWTALVNFSGLPDWKFNYSVSFCGQHFGVSISTLFVEVTPAKIQLAHHRFDLHNFWSELTDIVAQNCVNDAICAFYWFTSSINHRIGHNLIALLGEKWFQW
jgi:hypothetical protein